MFPYRDENPTYRTSYVTIGLILANLYVWYAVQGLGFSERAMADAMCDWAMKAGQLTGMSPVGQIRVTESFGCLLAPQPQWYTLLTMQFLHGGWLHLIGNMMFLWVFGNNIEDSMGHLRFLAFYLLCGVAAGLVQIVSDPASPVPAVGASGAISGVLGAYLWLYPRARVWMLIPIFIFPFRVALPAWVYLIYWAGMQLMSGVTMLARVEGAASGGVAFWAHIGGFAAGLFLVHFFVDRRVVNRKPYHRQLGRW